MAREIPDGAVCVRGLGTPLSSVAIALAREGLGRDIWVVSTEGGDLSRAPSRIGLSMDPTHRRRHLVSFAELVLEIVPRYQPFEFMRPAQLDACARSNNVLIERPGDRLMLPGCGGIADATSVNGSLVYYLPRHDPRTLVPSVDFCSGAGRTESADGLPVTPRRVITELGVIGWRDGVPTVESLHPGTTADELVTQTGFDLQIPDSVGETEPPTADERRALRALDPERLRDLEFERGPTRAAALLRAIRRAQRAP